MASERRVVFPLGVYGLLVFALCWLTLAELFRPLDRLLLGLACQPPRLLAACLGQPAHAARAERADGAAAAAAELAARVRAHAVDPARPAMPASWQPRVVPVLGVGRRQGGGGMPCELLLGSSYAELEAHGTQPWVTKADALLGVLAKPGSAEAPEDTPADPARVVLANHPLAPPFYAAMSLPEGGSLRLVVRAAATVDPAALRVELWDNPYRAARLDTGGHKVWTLALPGAESMAPPGLWLGRTRIWGYEAAEREETLAIGVFVAPPFQPAALSHVVLWESQAPAREAESTPLRRVPALVAELPGSDRGRHLVDAGAPLPDGSAVVVDGTCLGTVRSLAFGVGLMTAFPASRQAWNLLLLPDEPAGRPLELRGSVVHRDGAVVVLRCRGDDLDEVRGPLPSGLLFTGSNGPHCPSGLLLGRVAPYGHERDLVSFQAAVDRGPHHAEVVTGADR